MRVLTQSDPSYAEVLINGEPTSQQHVTEYEQCTVKRDELHNWSKIPTEKKRQTVRKANISEMYFKGDKLSQLC